MPSEEGGGGGEEEEEEAKEALIHSSCSHAKLNSLGRNERDRDRHATQKPRTTPLAGLRLHILASPSLATGDEASFHVKGYGRNLVKRVCRSTLEAETYTLQGGVEKADGLRAMLADMHGLLDEASAAKEYKQIWFTGCESLRSTFVNPRFAKNADKLLSPEIA